MERFTSFLGRIALWVIIAGVSSAIGQNVSPPGGGGTPGGSNTQIQFNNSGAFGGSANLTWTNGSQHLVITGTGAGAEAVTVQQGFMYTDFGYRVGASAQIVFSDGSDYGRGLAAVNGTAGLKITDGSSGIGDITSRTNITSGFAIGSLPTGVIGMRAYVTDQITACAAIGVAPTAGGALKCPVFFNGSAWVGG